MRIHSLYLRPHCVQQGQICFGCQESGEAERKCRISSGFKETAPTVNEAWNEPTVSDGLNVYCNYTEAEKSNSFIYFICLFFRAQTSHCPQIAPVVSDCMRMSISQSCHVTDLSERTCWCLGDTSMLHWSRRPTANVPFNLNMNH